MKLPRNVGPIHFIGIGGIAVGIAMWPCSRSAIEQLESSR